MLAENARAYVKWVTHFRIDECQVVPRCLKEECRNVIFDLLFVAIKEMSAIMPMRFRETHMTYFWTQKLKERHSIKVEEIIISFYAFLRAGDCVKMAEERTH